MIARSACSQSLQKVQVMGKAQKPKRVPHTNTYYMTYRRVPEGRGCAVKRVKEKHHARGLNLSNKKLLQKLELTLRLHGMGVWKKLRKLLPSCVGKNIHANMITFTMICKDIFESDTCTPLHSVQKLHEHTTALKRKHLQGSRHSNGKRDRMWCVAWFPHFCQQQKTAEDLWNHYPTQDVCTGG